MASQPMRAECVVSTALLHRWTGGVWTGYPPKSVGGVALDSRVVRQGDLFVALRGSVTDGHDHADDAVRHGASALLISTPLPHVRKPCLLVADTQVALERMARGRRETFTGTVTALTGSVGKTTVKDMAAAIFREVAPTCATVSNFNNATGVPLTLLGLRPDARFAVIEIGMSHSGEISRIVDVVQPHLAAVINVKPVHLENFSGLSEIASAKAEIFEGLQSDGIAVLNADDPLVCAMDPGRGITRVTFGTHAAADLRLEETATVSRDCQRFTLWWHTVPLSISLRLPGRHNRVNAAAAATMALAVGAEPEHVLRGLADLSPGPMRSRLLQLADGTTLLEDCYNASPAAFRAALETLAGLPTPGSRVVVMGDMLELGVSACEFHRETGIQAAALGFSTFLGLGPLSRHAVEAYRDAAPYGDGHHFEAPDPLLDALFLTHCPGDLILIKGSRGMRMERVVAGLLARIPPVSG